MVNYVMFTNEDLVTMARSGDDEALEQLFIRNKRFVYKIVNKFNLPTQLFDDAVSEAHIGMLKAFKAFDPEKGFKFTTYAGMCMYNEVLTFLKRQKFNTNVTSLDKEVTGEGQEDVESLLSVISSNDEPIEDKVEKIVLVEKLNEFFKYIEDHEKVLLTERIFKGRSQYAVADMLGIAQPTVSVLERSLLKEFKEFVRYEEVI